MILFKRRSHLIFLLFFSWGWLNLIYGQNSSDIQPICGTDFIFKQAVERLKIRGQNENLWEQKLQRVLRSPSFHANRELFTIPIVVHIMHTGTPVGEEYNISDEQVQEAIDYTNQMYRAQNGFQGADIEMEFVLAKRTPECQGSGGIVRVDMSDNAAYVESGISVNGGIGVNERTVKSRSVWPNDQYINVWVIHKIEGQDGTSGRFIAGYAYQPSANPDAITDGVVLLASQMKAGNETLGHELGHSFNLFHTFEGDGDGSVCPANDDCTLDGDRVCDTDPHQRTNFSCNQEEVNPCTASPLGLTITNHMDYSSCSERFTEGQKSRMRAALIALRGGLLRSQATSPAPPNVPTVACIPDLLEEMRTFGLGPTRVEFADLDFPSETHNTEATYLDWVCQGVANVEPGESYEIAIRTESNPQKVRVFIDYNNDGDFEDEGELVFSSNEAGSNLQIHRGTITIPIVPLVTNRAVRMRVLADVLYGGESPCGPLTLGQIEDYSLIIHTQDAAPPIIIQAVATNITETSARMGANVTDSGGSELIERGIIYGLTSNVDFSDQGIIFESASTADLGIFSIDFSDLPSGTTIYFKGYAINETDTAYTAENFFVTLEDANDPPPTEGITEIFNFQARPQENGVNLSWEALEVNNLRFEVEQSLDSLFFSAVSEIEGQGTVPMITTYDFLDKPNHAGKLFYRIKAIAEDGSQQFSDIVVVIFDTFDEFLIFPNPAEELVQVEIPYLFSDAANLIVVDAIGRQLYNKTFHAQQGESVNIFLDATRWAKGMYFATLFDGSQIYMQRIIKY